MMMDICGSETTVFKEHLRVLEQVRGCHRTRRVGRRGYRPYRDYSEVFVERNPSSGKEINMVKAVLQHVYTEARRSLQALNSFSKSNALLK